MYLPKHRLITLLCVLSIASDFGEDVECPCGIGDWAPPPPEAKLWEYDRECDFDVLDAPPTQEVFDSKYWGKQPVLIKNVAKSWPAFQHWKKPVLWKKLVASGPETHNISHFLGKGAGKWEHLWLRDMSLNQFLCHNICKPINGFDQEYVFDRDGWNETLPWLADDAWQHFEPMAAHFEAEWHERWSRYFLVSAFGSGINFHAHTDAYNGLVYGRKRWFIYGPKTPPPSKDTGALEWFQTVYNPAWAAPFADKDVSGLREGQSGLLQCMQGEGDLIYLPRNFWHATVALGEGIGVSGQFVRMAHIILRNAHELQSRGQYGEANKLYRRVWDHRWDLEPAVSQEVLMNIAVMYHYQKNWKKSLQIAQKYLRFRNLKPEQVNNAKQVINHAKASLGQPEL